MPRLANRDGFALPLAILIIAILTAGLAAAFASTNAEMMTNAAQRGQNRAYNVAEAGLEQFVSRRTEPGFCQHCGDPLLVDSEYTRVSVPGGYADVVALKVRQAPDSVSPAIFFIRSMGVDTTVKISGGGTATYAQRTVGEYALWNTTTINVKASWVSLSGLVKNGTGVISGIDQCGQKDTVAGAMVPAGDITIAGNPAQEFSGSPPVDSSQTFAALKSQINLDWNGIINQNAIPADIEIPPGTFPSATMFTNNPNWWPVIHVHTNGFSLPNAGRGIIIADSDFTISGSNMWDGVVLIGGTLTSNGNNTTAGATLSGLNFLLGGTPSPSSVDDSDANGQKTYVYDSCKVANATKGMRHYSVLPNTWMDNVASW